MENHSKRIDVDEEMKNFYEHRGSQILDGLRPLRTHPRDELGFAGIIEGDEVPREAGERAESAAPHSMIVIEDEKHFEEVVAHAKAIGLYEGEKNDNLKNRLDHLAGYGGKNNDGSHKTRVRLFKDFAPYSFGFVIEAKNAKGEWSTWFHGGLVFHGAHDGNGIGSAPTLAVTLSPTVGWAIHT